MSNRPTHLFEPATALEMRLEAARHRHLNLSVDGKGGCNRPDISIWAGVDEDMSPAVVTMHVKPMWGQAGRYLDMTPDEADMLAHHLIETAKVIRREVAAERVGALQAAE